MQSPTRSSQSPAPAQPQHPATNAAPAPSLVPPAPIVLDVRPILAAGSSPCQAIDDAIPRVPEGGTLLLLVPFEPVPLYEKLRAHGFSHTAERLPDDLWRVTFHRDQQPTEPSTAPSGCGCSGPGPTRATVSNAQSAHLKIDARRLEPPQPMVQILEALEQLPDHGTLEAHTDRKPVHLLALLESRGCLARSETQPDGSCVTTIWRGPGPCPQKAISA
jgi:uncharacterized protein (DUF2249 family)